MYALVDIVLVGKQSERQKRKREKEAKRAYKRIKREKIKRKGLNAISLVGRASSIKICRCGVFVQIL